MRVTINTQPKADEDVFKAGTLVKSANGWIVLVTDGLAMSAGMFCGTVIKAIPQCETSIGEHSADWRKSEFVKFIGNVLLEQE